jgi:tol-pal system beta propeller repeat protein TolB
VALTVTAQAIEAIETQLAQIVATQTESAKPTPTATPTLTPIPVTFPPPGRIVFVSNRPGNKGSLMIMSADGSNVTQLTPVNTEAFHPSYSPPRNLVVYSTNQPPNKPAYLYTITLDGQVEANPGGQSFNDWWQPAFSPDGQRIAFVSARNGNMDIYSMNSDGSDLKQLTDDPARDLSPAWSPDNMRLAFVSERRGGADIFLMNADGSSPVRLTTNGHNPAWSPDGQQIAFVSTRDGNAEIYLAALRQGGQESRFTNTPQDENFPAFSLDGNWLAFTRYVDNLNHTEILVVTTTGREEHNLTNHPADDWQPIWVKGE